MKTATAILDALLEEQTFEIFTRIQKKNKSTADSADLTKKASQAAKGIAAMSKHDWQQILMELRGSMDVNAVVASAEFDPRGSQRTIDTAKALLATSKRNFIAGLKRSPKLGISSPSQDLKERKAIERLGVPVPSTSIYDTRLFTPKERKEFAANVPVARHIEDVKRAEARGRSKKGAKPTHKPKTEHEWQQRAMKVGSAHASMDLASWRKAFAIHLKSQGFGNTNFKTLHDGERFTKRAFDRGMSPIIAAEQYADAINMMTR